MLDLKYLIIFTIVFVINPFLAFVLAWLILFNANLKKIGVLTCMTTISAFWGILAFTQKSKADIDTDCIRYYYGVNAFESMSVPDAVKSLDMVEIMNFSFMPPNAIIVALTGNVQSISFLWVFLSYMFIYLSVMKLMEHFNCYSQKNFARFSLLLTFGFILFVQISELLKQGSAFAIFFYAFTIYINKGINWKTLILVLIAIGIHPSMMLCLPLFLYNIISTKKLLILIAILTPILMAGSIVTFFFDLLPGGQYFTLVTEKYAGGGSGQGATPFYIFILLLMLSLAFHFWSTHGKGNDYYFNIVLLYFAISFSCFNNIVAFLRFALFSYWLFAMILTRYIADSKPKFKFPVFVTCVVLLMFFNTTRFTHSRTFGKIYASSYMDNSILKISTSSIFDYLDEKYYRGTN